MAANDPPFSRYHETVARMRAAGCSLDELIGELDRAAAEGNKKFRALGSRFLGDIEVVKLIACGGAIELPVNLFREFNRTMILHAADGALKEADAVIDIGAGCGEFAASIARKYPATPVFAVDLEPHAVACIAELAKAGSLENLTPVEMDACHPRFDMLKGSQRPVFLAVSTPHQVAAQILAALFAISPQFAIFRVCLFSAYLASCQLQASDGASIKTFIREDEVEGFQAFLGGEIARYGLQIERQIGALCSHSALTPLAFMQLVRSPRR